MRRLKPDRLGNTVSSMEGKCTADENRKTVEMRHNDTAEDANMREDADMRVDVSIRMDVSLRVNVNRRVNASMVADAIMVVDANTDEDTDIRVDWCMEKQVGGSCHHTLEMEKPNVAPVEWFVLLNWV